MSASVGVRERQKEATHRYRGTDRIPGRMGWPDYGQVPGLVGGACSKKAENSGGISGFVWAWHIRGLRLLL